MSNGAGFYAVTFAVVLVLFPQGCQLFLDRLTMTPSDFARSHSVFENAAYYAPAAATDEKKARELATKAIANSDPQAMNAAIDASRDDPTYVYQRGALKYVRGQSFEEDFTAAQGMTQRDAADSGKNGADQRFKVAEDRTNAVLIVLQGTKKPSPEWDRANRLYCSSLFDLAVVSRESGVSANSTIVIEAMPKDTCN